MQTVKIVILVLISIVLLGACGLKGPLYLPHETTTPEAAKGQETDTTKDETEENEGSKGKDSGIE